MKISKTLFSILLISFLSFTAFQACSDEAGSPNTQNENSAEARASAPVPDGTITEQVQFLVDRDRYEEALAKLRNEDMEEPEIQIIVRDTHLHYGNWLMYQAETIHMTERMPMALAHFRRVLQLDPNNRQAQANIQQIEEIYESLGREIPDGIAE
ncbi:MAG: hypothetical protein LAT84_03435 [Balneolia bacterium]|nr:hypothetical protein [Balneolia bacterium]